MFGSQLSDAVNVTAGLGIAPQLTVSSTGAPDKTGAVVSSTTICCISMDVLPQSSVAVQILSSVKECTQAPGIVFSVKAISTLVSQLSVAEIRL